MRKILFMLMLVVLSLPTFAQNLQWIDTVGTTEKTIRLGDFDNNTLLGSWYYSRLPIALSQAQIDSLQNVVVSIIDTPSVKVSGVTLTADSLTIKSPTAITNGTKLVASTAAALAGSASAKYVVITNNNASGTVYWGGTGVTTATGEPIYPMMQVMIPIANAATVYVIGAAVTVRYKILN